MILTELQTYLAEQNKASLAELEIRFSANANALRGMLDRLIRKGRVRQLQLQGKKCSGCTTCKTEMLEFYQWIDKSNHP